VKGGFGSFQIAESGEQLSARRSPRHSNDRRVGRDTFGHPLRFPRFRCFRDGRKRPGRKLPETGFCTPRHSFSGTRIYKNVHCNAINYRFRNAPIRFPPHLSSRALVRIPSPEGPAVRYSKLVRKGQLDRMRNARWPKSSRNRCSNPRQAPVRPGSSGPCDGKKHWANASAEFCAPEETASDSRHEELVETSVRFDASCTLERRSPHHVECLCGLQRSEQENDDLRQALQMLREQNIEALLRCRRPCKNGPAAIEQLKSLVSNSAARFTRGPTTKTPSSCPKNGVARAKRTAKRVVIPHHRRSTRH